MTTIHKKSAGRIAAAALLVAAGATVASVLGATTPANAAPDQYIYLSVGYAVESPPVVTVGGSAIGPNAEEARIASLINCADDNGGGQCTVYAKATNACAAAAANDAGERTGASNASLEVAKSSALSQLQFQEGAHIVVSGCSSGLRPPPHGPIDPGNPPPLDPTPPEPPAPLLGPTVSWDVIIGGLEAHITDRSGVSSQCTYATDDYNRSFALPANSSYDLRIVPAIPQFRNWTVTITCDNGTSTTATTFF